MRISSDRETHAENDKVAHEADALHDAQHGRETIRYILFCYNVTPFSFFPPFDPYDEFCGSGSALVNMSGFVFLTDTEGLMRDLTFTHYYINKSHQLLQF